MMLTQGCSFPLLPISSSVTYGPALGALNCVSGCPVKKSGGNPLCWLTLTTPNPMSYKLLWFSLSFSYYRQWFASELPGTLLFTAHLFQEFSNDPAALSIPGQSPLGTKFIRLLLLLFPYYGAGSISLERPPLKHSSLHELQSPNLPDVTL